jgi:hypothetical protein
MKKASIFETAAFTDVINAQATIDAYDGKVKRIKIGLILCGVSFLLLVLCAYTVGIISNILFYGSLLTTLAAYIVGGGLGIAIRTAFRIAGIGWIILPFPLDIFTGLVTLIFSLTCFACLPVVFILINLLQTIRDKRHAEEFIDYCENQAEQFAAYQANAYAQAPVYAQAPYYPQNAAPVSYGYAQAPTYAQAPAPAQQYAPVYQAPQPTAPAHRNPSSRPAPPPFHK